MIVIKDKKDSALFAVTRCQIQLTSSPCCICMVSFKVMSLTTQLDWVAPATRIPITCNSNHKLEQFKGMYIAVPTHYPFGPDFAMTSFLCLDLVFSIAHHPLEMNLLRCGSCGSIIYRWLPPSEVYHLCCGLIHSHRYFRVKSLFLITNLHLHPNSLKLFPLSCHYQTI